MSITNRVLGSCFLQASHSDSICWIWHSSEESFAQVTGMMQLTAIKAAVLFFIFSLTYHLVAGVKHLLLDFHIGDSFEAAQSGSGIVVLSSLCITGLIGFYLW